MDSIISNQEKQKVQKRRGPNVDQMVKEKWDEMQTNPVREAIVNLQESNQDSLSILVEEMVSLERF